MKKLFLVVFLLLLTIPTYAQLGSRYVHVDTLNVTTTERDTTWTDLWEQVTIHTNHVDVWLKIGAPDYGDWSSRNWLRLDARKPLVIGPSPRLKKLAFKSVQGTGVIYLTGYKKERQY